MKEDLSIHFNSSFRRV